MTDTSVKQLALDFLGALVSNVGIDETVRLVAAAVGKDNQARAQAILAAEFAAVDAAVDVLEEQKLQKTSQP